MCNLVLNSCAFVVCVVLNYVLHPVLCGRVMGINLSINSGSSANLYQSPCPDVFQYYVENNVLQYGLIKVYAPDDSNIQLNVEISVGNDVQGYNGDLELAASRTKTIEDIIHRRHITYKIHFPKWENTPPKITKITVNGNLICFGPPINIKSVRILTTVNLQHTLKINMNPTNSETTFQAPDTRFQTNRNYSHYPNLQPTVNNNQIPPISFNPTLPKDPTKIYQGNPFLYTSQPAPSYTENTYTPEFFEQPVQVPTIPTRVPQVFNKFPDVRGDSYKINSDICGLSVATNALVANGKDVSRGQYPWLVAIFLIRDFGTEFLCGANLISTKHVITAGHCMKANDRVLTTKKIFLKLGQHNIQRWTPDEGSRVLDAASIAVHPDYHSMSADGDIAVVTLAEEVEFTKYIRPICLWHEIDDINYIVDRIGTVVGWGKDESNNVITPEPKQINFPVVSQEVCLRSHHTFREITSHRTFCAGFRNGSGPCNGDSGGGFLMKRGDRWTLRGLVSMSIAKDRTCDFSEYFVFTDVTKFNSWIMSVIT